MRRLAAVLAAMLLLGACTSAQTGSGTVVRRAMTATYVYSGEQHVYAYWTTHRSGAPWMLLVHGGYWRYGDGKLAWTVTWAQHERARGYQAFSIDYRLSTVATWPAPLQDVQAAIVWVRDHASTFGLDPDRGVLVGHSSGGQLSTIAAFEDARIAGAVDLSGAVDPSATQRTPHTKLAVAARFLLGCPPASCPARWTDAQAISHVGPATPPLLIVHSRGDPTVPVAMSTALQHRLGLAHRPVIFDELDGATHDTPSLPAVLKEVDRFADRNTR